MNSDFLKKYWLYIRNNQRAHPHGHPIHVRLFWMLQLVDNCHYQSCHLHVNWDHVLRIDNPRILDTQRPYNTKLMQGWWTETIDEMQKNEIEWVCVCEREPLIRQLCLTMSMIMMGGCMHVSCCFLFFSSLHLASLCSSFTRNVRHDFPVRCNYDIFLWVLSHWSIALLHHR